MYDLYPMYITRTRTMEKNDHGCCTRRLSRRRHHLSGHVAFHGRHQPFSPSRHRPLSAHMAKMPPPPPRKAPLARRAPPHGHLYALYSQLLMAVSRHCCHAAPRAIFTPPRQPRAALNSLLRAFSAASKMPPPYHFTTPYAAHVLLTIVEIHDSHAYFLACFRL